MMETNESNAVQKLKMMPKLASSAIQAVMEDSSKSILFNCDFMDALSWLHDNDEDLYDYLSQVRVVDVLGNVLSTDDILKSDFSHDKTLSKLPLHLM